tara:strand:- start:14 stop:238 length:225 start_codon:yes stop_codon:yes gene_type:complete
MELLGVSMVETISKLRKEFVTNTGSKPTYLVLNAYTSSTLREELGYDDLYDLKTYKGLEIVYTLSEDEGSIRLI